jgi:hypothetical protein
MTGRRQPWLAVYLGAAALLATPGALRAQSTTAAQPADDAAQQVLAFERAFEDAVVRGDVAFVDAAIPDDFRFVHGDGWTVGGQPFATDDKAAFLQRVADREYLVHDLDGVSVELHGDVAITHGRYVSLFAPRDRAAATPARLNSIWFERVYTRRDGRWWFLSHRTVHGPNLAPAGVDATTTAGIPQFEVDPAWLKLPPGWVLGQVASTASDAQDHIWVLHRPRSVRPGQTTGPPVLELAADGTYLRGWGGPGQGYDWPESEHGIFVDYRGNVWIGGQGNDDQILKFTQDGKFLLQIGRPGEAKTNRDTRNLWRPSDVFVYAPTNELFVSDGYGNKRIIVFDADTGAFKRMWGAFGNVPLDDAPAAATPAAAAPSRPLATELDPADLGPPQFSTVHGVKVSNDGLVYAADRGGKRVQVFTLEGRYLTQVWIDRWCLAAGQGCGNGETAASVAFSADPEQRFLYVASRSPARIWVLDRKTLAPLDSFGRPGIAPGEFNVLHHMTTDSRGNLYTSEVQDGRRVQKFVFKGVGGEAQ